ncbi:MAG TPA: hypothetical protein VI338_06115 [Nitrososphaera sp.]|nr:hypothetical protein [Nitrososphaera sp.]
MIRSMLGKRYVKDLHSSLEISKPALHVVANAAHHPIAFCSLQEKQNSHVRHAHVQLSQDQGAAAQAEALEVQCQSQGDGPSGSAFFANEGVSLKQLTQFEKVD